MSRSRSWLCTWNDFPEDWQAIIIGCGAVDYSAQKEIGEGGKEKNKEHIQFAVRFEEAKSFRKMQDLFKGAHIEPAKDWIKAKQYCMKKDTRVEVGIQKEKEKVNAYNCPDPMEGRKLRPVQQEIIDIIKEKADDRTIHWFYDQKGNIGKTTLAKSLCIQDETICCLGGKASDMKYAVHTMCIKEKPPRVVFLNIARSVEQFVSYQGIEEVKDGFFFSTKYECGQVIYPWPHVIILANFYPDTKTMSPDRWVIHTVDENGISHIAGQIKGAERSGYDDEQPVKPSITRSEYEKERQRQAMLVHARACEIEPVIDGKQEVERPQHVEDRKRENEEPEEPEDFDEWLSMPVRE